MFKEIYYIQLSLPPLFLLDYVIKIFVQFRKKITFSGLIRGERNVFDPSSKILRIVILQQREYCA
ncbi:hypothetical protein CEE45_06005 [Candidatus Heimdallarchaeota archaeon B3_Heim]|nr:MAG: hypothetical protein CEE45_06005 [Candidatus Heimdallarchaeota archaeon B3_Heim]